MGTEKHEGRMGGLRVADGLSNDYYGRPASQSSSEPSLMSANSGVEK